MRRIFDRREAAEGIDDGAEAEGLRNGEDCAEHQLRLHVRQRDVPEFLPTVLDTVDRARLIEVTRDVLQTCDEGQERRAKRGPKGNNDTERHDIVRILEPKDRVVDDAEVDQRTVDPAVGVRAEQGLPDKVDRAGNRRCVEDQSDNRTKLRSELVDKPRDQQRQQVGHRACDGGEDQRVLASQDENVVVKEEADVVVQPEEVRKFQQVEVGEAQDDRQENREDGEDEEEEHKGRDHDIRNLVLLHFTPCPLRFGRFALCRRTLFCLGF